MQSPLSSSSLIICALVGHALAEPPSSSLVVVRLAMALFTLKGFLEFYG
jgi:hypothetical protein